MRQLGRRLARVADASTSSTPPPETAKRRCVGEAGAVAPVVPEGHVPVHVGEEGTDAEAERFLVRAELLGRAAQEYGYGRRGPLRTPCSPAAFRRALASLVDGGGSGDHDG